MSLPTAEQQKERKSQIAAILGTIVFHALLIMVLLFMAFRTPLPLPGEEGVEVNLGYSDDGMGDLQPEEAAIMNNTSPSQPTPSDDEAAVTENNEETPSIEKINKKIAKETPKPIVTKPQPDVPKEPSVNQNALYKGKNSQSKTGGSQGITGKPGDQGNPNGTPGSPNYLGGGGKGNGIDFDLGGRGAVSLPKPVYNSLEQGTIVVTIKVDRLGNVVSAQAGARGTTITEIGLRQQAEIAARKTKFVAKPDAPEEQRGTITYRFVKQN